MTEISFSTKLNERPITIDNKRYCVREIDGEQREAYSQTFDLGIEIVDGKPKISTKEGFKMPSELDLLVKCVYDDTDTLVPLKVLKKWPTTLLTKLHTIALELSGLDKDAKAKAKNDLEASGSSGTN